MREPPKTMATPMISSLILIIASGQQAQSQYNLTDIIDKSVVSYNPANLVIVIDGLREEEVISGLEISGIKESLLEPRQNGTLTTSIFIYEREAPESYSVLNEVISSSRLCSLVILASESLLDTLERISKQKCRGHLKVILAYDNKNTTHLHQPNLEVITWEELKEDKDPRLKLSGRVVRAVQDEYFPYFFTTSNGSFDGYFYQVSQIIAERLNITIEFIPNTRDPGIWGYIQPDGTWNGMMAMVMNGEADMAAPGFFRHPDRDRAVDFSVNVVDAAFVLFTQRNSRNRISMKNYLGEFTTDVWVLIGITSFLLTLAFIMFLRIWNGYYQNTQSLSIVLRGLVYKGSKEPSKRYSVKSLMIVNLLFASVIVISYRSCLNAFLTIQVPVLDVKSFEDIERSGKALTFWKGGLMEGVLSASSEGTIERKMYEKYLKDEKAQVESYEEGMQNAIEDENYVFVGPSMLSGMTPCNVTQVPNYVFKSWLICFTFTQGSTLVKYFNEEILRLRQEGILHLLSERYFHSDRDKGGQECNLSRTSVSLTFDHVFTPFSILAMGLFAGIFFGIIERLFGFSMVKPSLDLVPKSNYDHFQKVKAAEALLSIDSLGYDKKFELLKGLFSADTSAKNVNKGV